MPLPGPRLEGNHFATRQPWTKQQNDDHKKEWKDVIRYRGDERGDVIFRLTLEEALARHAALGSIALVQQKRNSRRRKKIPAPRPARSPLRVRLCAWIKSASRTTASAWLS